MTRFRAYATDSDEDDNASASSSSSSDRSIRMLQVDQDDEQSDSGESMVEKELFQTAPRHRDRRISDDIGAEDDEMQSDDEDEDNNIRARPTVPNVPAAKPPPRALRRQNPTIIPRARELGIDPQKMHVMQASLFRMPEEEAAMKALAQTTRRKLQLSAPLSRKRSRDSEGEGFRSDSRQRASFAHDIEPPPYRPSRKYARVEGSASAVSGSEGAFIDSGLALGRSFRVGWGPGGTLVHLGQLCGPQSKSKTTANSSIVKKSTVPLLAGSAAEFSEAALKLLSHHLTNTPIEPDVDGVPFANAPSSLTFSTLLMQFPPTDHSFEACLFRLGHTLFDPIDLRIPDSTNMDIRRRIYAIRRKAAFSNWLQDSISSTIHAELRDNPGADWAATVFTLLTGNQIEKACEVAMDSGNVKVASLISQCPGDEDFRIDLQAQVALWREQHVDAHISKDVRKIYALLAGTAHVLEGSKGTGVEQCADVNVAAGLSWKRAFGLHLWFGQLMDTSIADVFRAYDLLWRQPAAGVAPPVPWYVEQGSAQALWKLPSSAADALFSLVRVFADPACSLSNILSPLSFSASPVDYRLAWHLYVVLSRCLRVRDFADRQSLGMASYVDSESDEELVEGHSPSADLLANSYAMQLEQAGMIQEAAFVLLHIEGSAGRAKAVKELLNRSAAQLDDWMTRGLVGSLKLPMAWVNEAKAIYALDSGDVYGAYELYLAAGLWNAAHELAVLELAPDAVIRQDLVLLHGIFDRFLGHVVDGWHVRGKAFLDYVHAMTRLPELRAHVADASAVPDAALASELEQLARSVPKLISILPDVLRDRADARHTAALAEMTAGLTLRLDQVKPRAITPAQVRTSAMSEATQLRTLQTSAYERFLRSIEIA